MSAKKWSRLPLCVLKPRGGWGRRGEGRLPLSSTDEQRPVWSCPRSCRRRPHHSHPVSMSPSLPHPHSTTRPSVCVLPTNPTHNTTHGNRLKDPNRTKASIRGIHTHARPSSRRTILCGCNTPVRKASQSPTRVSTVAAVDVDSLSTTTRCSFEK